MTHASSPGTRPAVGATSPVSAADWRKRVLWALFFLAWLVVLKGTWFVVSHAIPRYLTFTLESYGEHFWLRRPWILIHVLTGAVAIVCGLLQFWPWLRKKHRLVHRWVGRTYVSSIAVGGIAGLLLAVRTEVSTANTIGLTLMGIAWLTITGIAFWHARRRRFNLHAQWMTRSFIVTLAFVVVRLGDQWLTRFDIGTPTSRLSLMAWAAWVGPLVMFEVFRRLIPGPSILAVPRQRRVDR